MSTSQDAGGHTLSCKDNLTFGIGLHVVGVRTVAIVRTLRHNHIFSDGAPVASFARESSAIKQASVLDNCQISLNGHLYETGSSRLSKTDKQ